MVIPIQSFILLDFLLNIHMEHNYKLMKESIGIVITGHCRYGVDLAKQLAEYLHNVLARCGSVRISFSRRTPQKVLIEGHFPPTCPVCSILMTCTLRAYCFWFPYQQLANLISKEFSNYPKVYIWDGEGKFSFLAHEGAKEPNF